MESWSGKEEEYLEYEEDMKSGADKHDHSNFLQSFRGVKYWDCHTHRTHLPDDESAIINLRMPATLPLASQGLFSAGLHPWDTVDVLDAEVEIYLTSQLASPQVVAIGEAGLDRLRGASLDVQSRLFKIQAKYAQAANRPVIIHLVRAIPELIRLKQDLNPQIPWIIHGVNLNPDKALMLINAGCHLSFGAAILHPTSPAAQALKACPLDKILLETDDWNGDIKEVYTAAARLRNMPVDELSSMIMETFRQVFRIT